MGAVFVHTSPAVLGQAGDSGVVGGVRDGDLLCFVMRENFLIIFIQIFLINSLIFLDERARELLFKGGRRWK